MCVMRDFKDLYLFKQKYHFLTNVFHPNIDAYIVLQLFQKPLFCFVEKWFCFTELLIENRVSSEHYALGQRFSN
jgi:hypothetical protein